METLGTMLLGELNTSVTPEQYAPVKADAPFEGRSVPGYPPKIAHAIMHAQNELAFYKWHLQKEGGLTEEDEFLQAWRARIAQLRAACKG